MPDSHRHFSVVIVGAGQAGLATSHFLTERGIDHVLFEKNSIGHAWKAQRWDSFCLVTPNWQCRLPGFVYEGDDPHGFMLKNEVVRYVESYAAHIGAPVETGVAVTRLARQGDRFLVDTSSGACTADQVVLAVGGYHRPNVPALAERLPAAITQLHSSTYRNPQALPEGEVLVVGSGQSGCQIAEDLHLAGRKVHLAVGSAPRCPRLYRGRDSVDWLDALGQYDLPVDQHPLKERVRRNANHYLTGRDGGRDIDLRLFASQGMKLYGRLQDVAGDSLFFADDLSANLDNADRVYNGICNLIDDYIAKNAIDAPAQAHYRPVWKPGEPVRSLALPGSGITSVIWTTGFRSDWSWVDLPIFDGSGYPSHSRGVTSAPGIYVVGLPWLYTWGSGRFVGVGRDAAFVVERIAAHTTARLRNDAA